MPRTKSPDSIESKVFSRIKGRGAGWVFTPSHFSDLGARPAVASALNRIKARGIVRLLARGIYDYPIQHPVLGTVAPSTDAVARALSARDATRLQPAGAYAVNILGLSEQVPSKAVFLTDGPARKIKIGQREIILQHTTARNMATAGRKSGLVIQALRHLGKDQVDDHVLAILRRQTTDADRKQFAKDLRHAPAWIAAILRSLSTAA